MAFRPEEHKIVKRADNTFIQESDTDFSGCRVENKICEPPALQENALLHGDGLGLVKR